MKKTVFCLTVILSSVLFGFLARAAAREGYTPVGEAVFDGLTITSFSELWDAESLQSLYDELLLNTHGDELALLGHIYLYPDAPDGVAGNYFEDVSYNRNGTLSFGANAYIELFNMDRRLAATDVAHVLAHEYGHHYTIVNITAAERRYYSEWGRSEYARVRNLAAFPVEYGMGASRLWSITEIAANDYVQLLGSPNARRSFDYPDANERLDNDISCAAPSYFNKRPQENSSLPLAADVEGLYNYLLGVGGYTAAVPAIVKPPVIEGITADESFLNPKYTITWTAAEGNGPFEYTAIMFPMAFSAMVEPLRTVMDHEALSAVFGTVTRDGENGSMRAILDYYAGDYVFVVYAKDADGFMYASKPVVYSFGHTYFDALAHIAPSSSEEQPPAEALAVAKQPDAEALAAAKRPAAEALAVAKQPDAEALAAAKRPAAETLAAVDPAAEAVSETRDAQAAAERQGYTFAALGSGRLSYHNAWRHSQQAIALRFVQPTAREGFSSSFNTVHAIRPTASIRVLTLTRTRRIAQFSDRLPYKISTGGKQNGIRLSYPYGELRRF